VLSRQLITMEMNKLRGMLPAFFLSLGLLISLALGCGMSVAKAALPDALEFKTTDRVFWKGKGGENYLILNVFAHESRLKPLPKLEQNKLLINSALIEGARLLARPEHAQLTGLSILIVSMRDMSEYGGSNSKWTQVGTASLAKGAGRVQLTDLKLSGDLPSPLPTLAFPIEEAGIVASPTNLRFLMPTRVHVVAGTDQQFFYENLIVTKDADAFLFVPSGAAMSFTEINRRGVRFRATQSHIGEHQLTVKVTDWEGRKVAEGTTTVVVSAANAGATMSEPVRILVLGHSLPSMYWPAYLADHLSGPGNPPVEFVGGIKYWYGTFPDFRNNPPLDRMFHQASPGYSVSTLLSLYSDQPPANPNMPTKSPFLFKNGKEPPKIDMKRYLESVLKGKAPHIVILNIGDNDTFHLDPAERDSATEKQFVANMNALINHLREIAPKAIIGAMMPNTYNDSEKSFIQNYGPKHTRWLAIQNRQRYIELMYDIAKSRGDMEIIASNFAVDGIDGMPYNSGTHFNNLGANQFAVSAYSWLKAKFAAQTGGVSAASVKSEKPQKQGWLSRIKSVFQGN
jgi:lysophospholipase L1-like esterase